MKSHQRNSRVKYKLFEIKIHSSLNSRMEVIQGRVSELENESKGIIQSKQHRKKQMVTRTDVKI